MAYLMDYNAFRIPAGASVLIFFAFLIGVAGAYAAYLLESWAIPGAGVPCCGAELDGEEPSG